VVLEKAGWSGVVRQFSIEIVNIKKKYSNRKS